MSYTDNRKFVGAEDLPPLLPIYKGRRKKIYPGQLALNKNHYKSSGISRNTNNLNSGLRRYVFRYENGTFVYLATRKGQRNGGFNSKESQTSINFTINVPGTINETRGFSFKGKNIIGEDIYEETANSRIRYDSANTRWVWETRPATTPPAPPSGPFYVTAKSSSTSNSIGTSSTSEGIVWTYVVDPFGAATPELPATVTIVSNAWYNNNDLANLNKWPIKNTDANFSTDLNRVYRWQPRANGNYFQALSENRPSCLTDSILFKCFEGIPLKPYEIVFIEVVWTFLAHVDTDNEIEGNNVSEKSSKGYDIDIIEWWSPAPIKIERQKGRIYRVGKLEADTGIGNYDKVIFAQRTRVITTKYSRGGLNALE